MMDTNNTQEACQKLSQSKAMLGKISLTNKCTKIGKFNTRSGTGKQRSQWVAFPEAEDLKLTVSKLGILDFFAFTSFNICCLIAQS